MVIIEELITPTLAKSQFKSNQLLFCCRFVNDFNLIPYKNYHLKGLQSFESYCYC